MREKSHHALLNNFCAFFAPSFSSVRTGMLGLGPAISEEPDELDHVPTPREPPPSWAELDVETDLDVLQDVCYADIQGMLNCWNMVTGPSHTTSTSDTEVDDHFQIIPLLDATTKVINSVKNYIYNRHDLDDAAVLKIRQATLALLDGMKRLENRARVEEDEETKSEDGYIYTASDYTMLETERGVINDYLEVVDKYAFNPPHHIGAQTMKVLAKDSEEVEVSAESQKPKLPDWLDPTTFVGDDIGRYHAMLDANRQPDTSAWPNGLNNSSQLDTLPNPNEDKRAFLEALSDGQVLCNAYNNIVKRSKRPFGLINKIHLDTARTYRATENLKFFAAACKFRFDINLDPFNATEIVRRTETGKTQLENTIKTFCEGVISELREAAATTSHRRQSLLGKIPTVVIS
ncbi:hypothetical protein BC938DRAFT_482016 [Jimgerdemannia flammicorona]|uniref:Calponin homology domain-containing protein n=1 Tax=Jimgerdemannia flammicorona TaxID=994334 RepID=A0A433QET5_9FUNG|nr:hypothetical protein BC938DRAFT_482016 [Jimgerdemannia flammicorona]